MDVTVAVLLAGLLSGALNAVGGGGTFVALPALVAFGVPPVEANIVSRIALTPGACASAFVSRREAGLGTAVSTRSLTVTSVLGGAVGALLLLTLPSASFDAAVPWLLAFATLLLALGNRLPRMLRALVGRPVRMNQPALLAAQFVLGVYGGYFGGAVGILMLSLWSVGLGIDAATSNPARIVQLAAMYLSASALFLLAFGVRGSPTLLLALLVGAVVGGYGGAHLARRLSAVFLRRTVLLIAATTTVLYFLGR
ncbi:sulfite exporter TauE/SafE family protein [Streptomyces sp. XM4193]|uniref:sulfite exporter TauE/SafE family protein n=1 Tax=Streptomyces sp. XM4193 TaxID=2929782 RepID=UPI001FFB5A92|nr:sulfite exporter TauE/SafE family protein [Streptomyces sp. XM4193]MCK1798376.1 sulfite exporter TauE/SafE family protein [Streptomyces sp. XM4193]